MLFENQHVTVFQNHVKMPEQRYVMLNGVDLIIPEGHIRRGETDDI